MTERRAAFAGVIVVWLVMSFFYILRCPNGVRNYDFDGHLHYTQVIANQHRFPAPREGWETHQTPLYYLINSRLAAQSPQHALYVRCASLVYGVLALFFIGRLLQQLKVRPVTSAIVLLFLCTTPMFVIDFTSYNNDSLATLCTIACGVLTWELAQYWRWTSAFFLLAAATAGLYTKYTSGVALAVFCVLVAGSMIGGHLSRERGIRLLSVFMLSGILFFPWLLFHNYAFTGKLIPLNASVNPGLGLPETPLKTLLMPPGFSDGEWHDPYTHQWGMDQTKKRSYTAYLLSSSIFGEYHYEAFPESAVWMILWLHLLAYFWALRLCRRQAVTRLAALTILLGALFFAPYFFVCRFGSNLEFRYIGWTWLPWGVLFAQVLEDGHFLTGKSQLFPLAVPFLSCIALQILLIGTLILKRL